MIPDTASQREIIWFVSMLVAFLAIVTSWAIIAYKYYLFRKPDDQGVRGNGAGAMLFIKDTAVSVIFALITLGGILLGISAMKAPEPVRTANRAQAEMIANVLTGVAVLIAVYALGNLYLLWRIDKKIRADKRKAWDGHERRTPPEGTKV